MITVFKKGELEHFLESCKEMEPQEASYRIEKTLNSLRESLNFAKFYGTPLQEIEMTDAIGLLEKEVHHYNQ